MNTETLSILLAEDDDTDVVLLRRAFKQVEITNPIEVVTDGQQAIDSLQRAAAAGRDRLPAIVMLDVKMPQRDGLQVLQWMRAQPVIRTIPAVVFTSSANRHDIERAYEAGANAYLVKPPSLAARADLARFIKEWLRLVQPPLAAVEGFRAAQAERALA